MIQDSFPNIAAADPEILPFMRAEVRRQQETLELIASENHVSAAVLEALGSVFTNKYAEGYPGKRYYGGCENMDAVEELARSRVKRLFGCDHANVQPHSGAQANSAVFLAVLKPGDTILSLDLAHGGHLSHGLKANISGMLYNIVHYGVSRDTEQLDYAEIQRLAHQHRPRLIISGASAYPRVIRFDEFSRIAEEVGAIHMADVAHIAGLIAVGLHPSPFPSTPIVTSTTHKTLRGPRGGLIMCHESWAKTIDSRIFPGSQGGPLMHVVAAKAVAFAEALAPSFAEYQRRIVVNAQALAAALAQRGNRLVSGGTDNHLMLLDLRPAYPEVSGKEAEAWLGAAGIIVNKNMIPFDERKPTLTSGLRIGTPALTTRGMQVDQMRTVAGFIDDVLRAKGNLAAVETVRAGVLNLCRQFPL